MGTYRVEVKTSGREVYLVEAESRAAAMDRWVDGDPIVSEVLDAEVVNVRPDSFDQ